MPSADSSEKSKGLRIAEQLLSSKAKKALGGKPIVQVWWELNQKFWEAIENHWEEGKQLLAEYDMEKVALDDLVPYMHPGTNWDLEEVGRRAALRLNALVRHNPNLDWANIPKLHPLQVVKALLGWLKPEWHDYQVPEDEEE